MIIIVFTRNWISCSGASANANANVNANATANANANTNANANANANANVNANAVVRGDVESNVTLPAWPGSTHGP